MISKYLKSAATYGVILAAGLAIGWAVPRVYEQLKPTYSEGDYSAYYTGTGTNVVVYGTPTCPYCAKTREYLQERQIQFTYFDVTTNDKARRDFARLNSRSVPVILVGRRRIDGFKTAAIEAALEAAGHHLPR